MMHYLFSIKSKLQKTTIFCYFWYCYFCLFSVYTWAINPNAIYLSTPLHFALPYTQITVNTNDGYELNTWVILPTATHNLHRVLIIAYGDTGNMSYYLDEAKAFCSKGYTCILFDYRGFGESSAFAINPQFLYYNEFGTDLACIIEWAKEQFDAQGIGVYAFSMGTVAATLALAQQSVDFLIAEGFVVNPTRVQQRLRDVSGKEVLLPICSQNYDLALQKLSLPILLFAGTLDPITTLEDSELFAKKQANRTLLAFKGKHGAGFLTLSVINYTSKIEAFLQKNGNKVVTPP